MTGIDTKLTGSIVRALLRNYLKTTLRPVMASAAKQSPRPGIEIACPAPDRVEGRLCARAGFATLLAMTFTVLR
jgi:hypothetical protein